MGLLFVGGVMNLMWIALIAAFVLVEKVLPYRRAVSVFSGVAMTVVGLSLLVTWLL